MRPCARFTSTASRSPLPCQVESAHPLHLRPHHRVDNLRVALLRERSAAGAVHSAVQWTGLDGGSGGGPARALQAAARGVSYRVQGSGRRGRTHHQLRLCLAGPHLTPSHFLRCRALLSPLNGALLLVSAYSAFYMVLDPLAGLSWALAVGLPMWLTATMWAVQVSGRVLLPAKAMAGGCGRRPMTSAFPSYVMSSN